MRNKILFWIVLIALLSLVPLRILSVPNFWGILKYPSVLFGLLQRTFGLTVFILMFWQIMIGANIEKWAKKLGDWIFDFHLWEGIVIYALAILHPLAFVLSRYFSGRGLDPISAFLGVCLLCDPEYEYFYTLGRVAFWLLTIGVFAGLYKHATLFMKNNWNKFHALNYVVFLLVGAHGFLLGPDFRSIPFFYFAIVAYLLVIFTIVRKIPDLIASYKKWISS
jgi:predicted ferric reductase